MSSEQQRTIKKKESFLENHIRNGRYVARTCRTIGISRWTFYNWSKNDPLFSIRVKQIESRESFRKAMFAEAWAKMRHKGISDLCRKLKISRWTYYNWVRNDPNFWPSIRAICQMEQEKRDQYYQEKYPGWINQTHQYKMRQISAL